MLFVEGDFHVVFRCIGVLFVLLAYVILTGEELRYLLVILFVLPIVLVGVNK